jgi:hypothetical protein
LQLEINARIKNIPVNFKTLIFIITRLLHVYEEQEISISLAHSGDLSAKL